MPRTRSSGCCTTSRWRTARASSPPSGEREKGITNMGQKLVGSQALTDGQTGEGRIGRTGEQIVSGLHGKFYEQAKRGNVYSGVTAVSGVAPGTAIGTTAAFALYNPLNSGFDLVVLKASMSYLSGTLGIGFVHWIMHTAAVQAGAAVTGTAISVVR